MKVAFELRLGERRVGRGAAIEMPIGAGDMRPEGPRKIRETWRKEGGGGGVNSGQSGLCQGSEAGAACARVLGQGHAFSREGVLLTCALEGSEGKVRACVVPNGDSGPFV